MKNWMIEDLRTGKKVVIRATTEKDAVRIARKYFDFPKCYGTWCDHEVEKNGWPIID